MLLQWQQDTGNELVVRPARRLVVFALAAYAVSLISMFHYREVMNIPPGGFVLWRIAVAAGALLVGYVYLFYRMTSLRVARDGMTKKSGIIVRDFSRVEINKITNCNYHRPLLALMLGFVNLKIETAGSTGAAPEITMQFLCMRDARAVMARMREERDAFFRGKGTEEVAAHA